MDFSCSTCGIGIEKRGYCRSCANAYNRAWRAEHPENCRKYESKKKPRTPEKERDKYVAAMLRANPNWKPRVLLTDDERRKRARLRQRKKRESAAGREKWRARKLLQNRVRRGTIQKLPCWTCGRAEVEAHHPAYSLPLDVVWLCAEHHHEVHACPSS